MNCDTAFDLMTDADGGRSLALARHLDDCPRCRAMQATLAPALDYLAPGLPVAFAPEPSAFFSSSGATGRRQPLVTADALAVARQCAAGLTARTDAPRVRLLRLTERSLRYAAVFAAGMLLAFTLFETRRPAAPVPDAARTCTRQEAARSDAQRTAAETRALALSCAACHTDAQEPREEPVPALKSTRRDGDQWLQQLLREDSLVAMLEAARCRTPRSVA